METKDLYVGLHEIRIQNEVNYEDICDQLNIPMQFAQEIDAGYADLSVEDVHKYANAIGARIYYELERVFYAE